MPAADHGPAGEAPETRAAVTDVSALLWNDGAPTAAGEPVGPETALRCPAVLACVSLLADTVAMLPVHLYRRGPDGAKSRATDDPRYKLLHDRPAPWLTSFAFRHRVQADFARFGQAFAAIVRAGDGRVLELHHLPASAVSVATDPATGEPTYRYAGRDMAWRDVLHLHGLLGSGGVALSPILMGRESIGLAVTLERHAAQQWGKGLKPSSVVKPKSRLSDEGLKRLRVLLQQWREYNNAGTLILPEDMDFESFLLTSVDGQFIEQRRFQIEEIARLWRIPLHKIGSLDRATNNNIEEQGREFLSDCLYPILRQWEQNLNIKLLSDEEQGEMFFEFLIDDLARADIERRFQAYTTAVGGPWLTANECRAAENRPPVAGGDTLRTMPGAGAADGETGQ